VFSERAFERSVPHQKSLPGQSRRNGKPTARSQNDQAEHFCLYDVSDRFIYLDSDVVVRKPLDGLFALPVNPDIPVHAAVSRGIHGGFNSGVLVVDPSRPLDERVRKNLGKLPSANGGDQGYLNAFFEKEWNAGGMRIPSEWNMIWAEWDRLNHAENRSATRVVGGGDDVHPMDSSSRGGGGHDEANQVALADAVKVWHFTGRKPWRTTDGKGYKPWIAFDEAFADFQQRCPDVSSGGYRPVAERGNAPANGPPKPGKRPLLMKPVSKKHTKGKKQPRS
jgi:lipopolysaccharide biosynthesis glycosyltransferase